MKKINAPPLFALLLLGYEAAAACTCMPPRSPAEARRGAGAVFAGEVVRVREPRATPIRNKRGRVVAYEVGLMAEVKLRVIETWKGVGGEAVTVRTMTGCCACGIEFVEGERYLVYAHGDRRGLTASMCSRTRTLEAAGEDLAELGEGRVPARKRVRTRAPRPTPPSKRSHR